MALFFLFHTSAMFVSRTYGAVSVSFETLETRALAHETLKQATLSLLFERLNGLLELFVIAENICIVATMVIVAFDDLTT
jgi:hypothetical protein